MEINDKRVANFLQQSALLNDLARHILSQTALLVHVFESIERTRRSLLYGAHTTERAFANDVLEFKIVEGEILWGNRRDRRFIWSGDDVVLGRHKAF